MPKVTRKGGGAALPWKTDLFRGIVAAVVREASPYGVPVTVKMRVGIDADHVTYLDAGRIAEGEGVAAVALHGRTAAQAYSGQADWSAIARLKEAVTSIPVLGNGDIWSAEDALEMVRQTGCDGVVVGRGCLGRPWLFTDLAAAFAGSPARVQPGLREVTATLRRHAAYLVDFYDGDEGRACRDIRKHIAWYLKGFPAGSTVRNQLALVDGLQALDDLIGTMDLDAPWPGDAAEGQRGRAGSPRVVALPENWLRSRELDEAQRAQVAQAELSVSAADRLGRSRQRLAEVGDEVIGVLEPDRQAQHVVVRAGLGSDRSVGQRGRVLDEGVDTAERHGVQHEPAGLRDGGSSGVAAPGREGDHGARPPHLPADQPQRVREPGVVHAVDARLPGEPGRHPFGAGLCRQHAHRQRLQAPVQLVGRARVQQAAGQGAHPADAHRPVRCRRDHAAHHVTVAPDVLRGGVEHQGRAVPYGMSGAPGSRRCCPPGPAPRRPRTTTRRDVDEVQGRVPRGLQHDQPGVGAQGGCARCPGWPR